MVKNIIEAPATRGDHHEAASQSFDDFLSGFSFLVFGDDQNVALLIAFDALNGFFFLAVEIDNSAAHSFRGENVAPLLGIFAGY